MVEAAERLISEIKQIRAQYVKEVGRGRRVWPRSIKDRAAELDRLGLSPKVMAEATGITYETILTWRHQRRKATAGNAFHALEVQDSSARLPAISKSGTVTVTNSEISAEPVRLLSLRTPQGFVIEGLDQNGVLSILARLAQQGAGHAS